MLTTVSWQSLVLADQNFQVEIQAPLLDISRQISIDEMSPLNCMNIGDHIF